MLKIKLLKNNWYHMNTIYDSILKSHIYMKTMAPRSTHSKITAISFTGQ